MRAAVIDKPGSAVCRQMPDPVPGPGECLLSPVVGGICGTDVHIFQGEFIGSYPIIPCHELAARVIEPGDAASGLKAGDLVAVDPNIRCGLCPACRRGEVNLCDNYQAIGVTRSGGFAELVCAPAANLHRIYCNDQTAAAFAEPLACVLYGLSRLSWQPGLRVMIWGAGAIGLLHLQVCKRLHGASVTVIDMDAVRMDAAVRLGADQGMLFTGEESNEQAHAPWDIVIDASGSAAAVNAMFKHLRRGGQALIFGVYPATERLAITPMQIYFNDWKIMGSCTYRHEFAAAARLISTVAIETQPLISKRIGLAEVPETLQHMAAGQRMGKVQVVL